MTTAAHTTAAHTNNGNPTPPPTLRYELGATALRYEVRAEGIILASKLDLPRAIASAKVWARNFDATVQVIKVADDVATLRAQVTAKGLVTYYVGPSPKNAVIAINLQ